MLRTKTQPQNWNIYDELVKAGIPLDNHESDLYALVTPESKALVDSYNFRSNVTTFTSKIDNKQWYDIPFAYKPFWEKHSDSWDKIDVICSNAGVVKDCTGCGMNTAKQGYIWQLLQRIPCANSNTGYVEFKQVKV